MTTKETWWKWDNDDTVSVKVAKRWLQWLGSSSLYMPDHQMPKSFFLFGWLYQPQPRSGPKKWWRDVIQNYLKGFEVSKHEWYITIKQPLLELGWEWLYRIGPNNYDERWTVDVTETKLRVECEECHRTFGREGEKNRHKCVSEKMKPVNEQEVLL